MSAALVLTVEETAELLRIGRSAAYAAVKAGEIPSIRVGRQIRVPRHLLEQLLGVPTTSEGAVTSDAPAKLGSSAADHEPAYT